MHDLIIIGGGPAGLTAAIYAARYRLNTLVLSEALGGEAAKSFEVENYPGFESISGLELMQKFEAHAKKFGVQIRYEMVDEVKRAGDAFLANGNEARALILATGTKTRKLGIPGEDKLSGRGVSYCATCDAAFFKDKDVAVVGGSDSAAEAAILLSKYSRKVYIIYRKDKLRCEPITLELIEKNEKIDLVYNANVAEVIGETKVDGVKLDNGSVIDCQGVFIEIGADPNTALAQQLGCRLDSGYIAVDDHMRSDQRSVYAAGDVTTGSGKFWQIITACGEGASAARSAYEDLQK